MAFGLQLERTMLRNGEPIRKVSISISDDGGIRKSIGDEISVLGPLRTGSYSVGNEGWCFKTSAYPEAPLDPQDPDVRKPRSGIEFSAAGQEAAAFGNFCGDELFGFTSGMSFSKFLEESEATKVVDKFKGTSYAGICCNHPTHPSLTIYFDDSGSVAWIKTEVSPGDLEAGSKYLPGGTAPANTSATILRGPLEYQIFNGREVLKNCSITVSTQKPSRVLGSSQHEFSNYAQMTDKLTRKIYLPEFELVDGSKVACFGNPSMTCEYRNGEVLVVVDGRSVEAAKQARFSRSSSGWFRFYAICGCGFALVFIFLIWYRNRGG